MVKRVSLGMKPTPNDRQEKLHRLDTYVSRHHGGKVEGSPKPFRLSQHYRIEGFEEGPQLEPHCVERLKPLGQ